MGIQAFKQNGIKRLFYMLLVSHAAYIFVTAVWPIVHIDSFMAVTGPKTDVWLVKTVGALLIPVALTMMVYCAMNTDIRPLALLAGGTALSFMIVDLNYALLGIISKVYLIDAAVEFFFLVVWIHLAVQYPTPDVRHKP